MLYKFLVRNVQEINIDRIIHENEEDNTGAEVLLITFGNSPFATLLISPKLLRKFKQKERLLLRGEFLWACWGRVACATQYGWRAKGIEIASIPLIIRQLKAARAYLKQRAEPKIVVKVHEL